jgi:hypothetical protein
MKSKTFKISRLFLAVETVERVSECVDDNDTCTWICESRFMTTASQDIYCSTGEGGERMALGVQSQR